MDIKLKKGIGDFTFGMKAEDVIAKLGKPDRIYEDEEDENELIYQYNKSKLKFTFYQEEDGKLGYIRCANPKLTYQGKPIIQAPAEVVIKDVFGAAIKDWQEEDYNSFVTYISESHWLVINAEYDEVTDIELGVPVKNEEEYDWAQ
ncbi:MULTISPECIES: hypothetical protein [Niastella]|uniref:Uncharacterized protein n=1 Tax=Niastella soli TaxID=2821487 RepID=A0ABS3YV06_9BACT|nr:hypothetical protein [Niastella soli]MBO9201372.1 hypothetical protein [Niastella soli]